LWLLNLPEFQLVNCLFPSPADDFLEGRLDLNKALIKNPSSTFYARVKGESMVGDGVSDGDLLVIDKSLTPYSNCLAVCFLNGEFTLKRVKIEGESLWLIPSNDKFKPIQVNKENDFTIWGIVSYIIKKVK
jgi:DNA polymerase V